MYLENAWYVAAWVEDIGRKLTERKICGQPLVMYRKENGDPVVLSNLCPHRFAPLSSGRIKGDAVQCGYHGMTFGETGKCVHNPHHGGHIPSAMEVRRYPAVDRHNLVWVWLGNPEVADASLIPDFSCLADPNFSTQRGTFHMDANYVLITDNLLDLSHAELVHEGILSSPGLLASKLESFQAGDTIWANRWIPDSEAPPAWGHVYSMCQGGAPNQDVDHWAYMRWDAPAHLLLDVRVTSVGGARSEGVWVYGTDIITPIDETHSMYFWGISRNHDIDDRNIDSLWEKAIEAAFGGQDKPMIESQQRMLGNRSLEEMNPVLIPADQAATRARRHLEALIKSGATPKPGAEALNALLKEGGKSRAPVERMV